MKAALYCRVSSKEQASSGYSLGQQLEALREYCQTNGLEVVNGIVLAESEHTEAVEGNHYFPPESMNLELFRESDTRTHCTWEGDGSHFTVEAGGETVEDAACYYPEPKAAVQSIKALKAHVAFYGDEVQTEG